MQAGVNGVLRQCRVGPLYTGGTLSIAPLIGPATTGDGPLPLQRVPAGSKFRLSEMDGQARVEEIQVFNGTSRPLVALEGDLLAGGFQDRIVRVSAWVPRRAAAVLPTACSEEGRFAGAETAMQPSGMVASPRFRRRLRLAFHGGGVGASEPSQRAVWDDIESDRRLLEVAGDGISLVALRRLTRPRCAVLAAGVRPHSSEIGWLFFVEGRFVAADLFFHASLPEAFREALLEAAAYDALIESLRRGPVTAWDIELADRSLDGFWRSLLAELDAGLTVRDESCAGTVQLRFESPSLAGSLLLDGPRPVHMSLFPALYAEDLPTLA